MVGKKREFAVGALHEIIGIVEPAQIPFSLDEAHIPLLPRKRPQNIYRVVGGTIIGNQDFQIGPSLRREPAQRILDEFLAVIAGDERRYSWIVLRNFNLPDENVDTKPNPCAEGARMP